MRNLKTAILWLCILCLLPLTSIKSAESSTEIDYLSLPDTPEESIELAINYMREFGIFYEENQEEFEAKVDELYTDISAITELQITNDYIEELALLAGGEHGRIIYRYDVPNIELFQMLEENYDNLSFWDWLLGREIAKVERDDSILIVRIPGLAEFDPEYYKRYVEEPLAEIQENLDDINGVLIDLTSNSGGYDSLMLAIVAPFLEDRTVYYNLYRSGQRRGIAINDERITNLMRNEPDIDIDYKIPEKVNVPIAVVVSGSTASAAEFTLLALMSQKDVREVKVFGTPTSGIATSTGTIRYDKDYFLMIGVGLTQLPDGTIYGTEPIEPDVLTRSKREAERKAMEWLNE